MVREVDQDESGVWAALGELANEAAEVPARAQDAVQDHRGVGRGLRPDGFVVQQLARHGGDFANPGGLGCQVADWLWRGVQDEWDLVVIGAGSGGVRASRVAASLGAKVMVVEGAALGGTCVNLGCVPKKLLVYAGRYARAFEEAAGFGFSGLEAHFDWSRLIARKDVEIDRLNGVYQRLLEGSGVTLLRGWAHFLEPQLIEVEGARHRAKNVLLATGTRAWKPNIPGIEHSLSSDQIFSLPELPSRILVVGGGYIACEFASLFRNLGRQVVLVHRGRAVLGGFDDDVEKQLGLEMQRRGLDLRFETELHALEKTASGLRAQLSTGETIEVDLVLMATGRRPEVSALGPGLSDLALDPTGHVTVDAQGRTNLEHVFAIGDLINTIGLTPVAIHEGTVVANVLFGDQRPRFHHELVPTAVFADPEVSSVGLTETGARQRLGLVDVYETRFRPLRHRLTGFEEQTYMKLIVDRKTDRVVGFHVVGPDAAEMTQGVAVAMEAGAKKADFDRTIGIHPTAAEEFVTMRAPRASAPTS